MRGRVLFVIGLGAGYVVGTRAGRPAYDALVARLRRVSGAPRVQQAAESAKEAFETRAPAAARVVEDAAEVAQGAVGAAKDASEAPSAPDEAASGRG